MIKRTPYNPVPQGRIARFYKNVKSQNVFIFVMLLSALTIFLPRWATGPVQKVCQAWLAPGGRMALLAARKISPRSSEIKDSGDSLTDQQQLRMLTAMSQRLQQLKRENTSLMGIRSAIGPRPVLVPARIVGFDSLGLPSVEIDRGTEEELKEGQPVLATIPLEVLRTEGLDPEVALAAATLVGTIDYGLGPYTARVKLISAIRESDKIYGQVVRFVNGKTEVVTPLGVYLQGTPKGDRFKAKQDNDTLIVKGAVDHGVKKGDFVITRDPERLNLPVPLIIGVVEKVESSTVMPIVVDLTIRPLFQKISLNKVYVLSSHTE